MKKRNSKSLTIKQINHLKERLNYDSKHLDLWVIFNLALQTGARATELVLLIQNVKCYPNNESWELITKGSKKRVITLGKEMVKNILSLKKEYNNRKAIQKVFSDIATIFCLERTLTPHDMRATTITMLDWMGYTITSISMWIGHSKIDTTMKYIKRSPLRNREISLALETADYSNPEQFNPNLKIILKAKNEEIFKLKHELEVLRSVVARKIFN